MLSSITAPGSTVRAAELAWGDARLRWKGAAGWVSGDPGAADLITLQGKACQALTGYKLTEQVWTVTPPSHVMSRVESVPGPAQASPR